MAKSRRRRRTHNTSPAQYRRRLAAVGVLIAFIALLMRFFAGELAALVAAGSRAIVIGVAQAAGLAAAVLGFAGLWRKEPEVLCGAAIVLGAVAIFFNFFVFAAFVALLVVVGIAVYRLFYKR